MNDMNPEILARMHLESETAALTIESPHAYQRPGTPPIHVLTAAPESERLFVMTEAEVMAILKWSDLGMRTAVHELAFDHMRDFVENRHFALGQREAAHRAAIVYGSLTNQLKADEPIGSGTLASPWPLRLASPEEPTTHAEEMHDAVLGRFSLRDLWNGVRALVRFGAEGPN